MEIKRIERGRYRGHLDLLGTMETMAPGETWQIPAGQIALRTVRNVTSVVTRTTEKVFTSQCPGLTQPYITIRRIR